MRQYIIRRLGISLITIWGIVTFLFLIVRLLPGDPAYVILGDRATPEAVNALRSALGLDQPLPVQYWKWLQDLVQLDLGRSLYSKLPIAPELLRRLGRTLELIVVSMTVSCCIGILLGIIAACGRKTIDFVVSLLSIAGLSSPSIVIGPILAFVLGVRLQLFPTSGYVSFMEDFWRHLGLLIMPVLSISFLTIGTITRMTRSSMLDVLSRDYVLTALAKGLPYRTVLLKHVLRNCLIPIVTLVGTQMGSMLGGTVITESLFNWPGLSTFLVDAAYHRDYPVIQSVILATATLFVFLNLTVDLVVAWLDPRVQYD